MRRGPSLLRNEWLLLGVIALIAAFLRFHHLDSIPLGLHSDEGFNAYEATRVVEERRPFIFFEEELGEEPMHIHCIAFLFLLLGQTPLVARMTSAVLGVVTVPMLYLLVKELFPGNDDKGGLSVMGLMAALWLALSYWHLNYSRLAMEPITLPLLITVTSYFFWRGIRSGRTVHYGLGGLFLGLSLYTYRAARLLPLMLLVYVACYTATMRRLDKRLLTRWVVLFAVALLLFLPLAHFAVTHPDIYFSRAGDVSIFNPALNGGSPLRAFLASTAKTAGSFHLLPDPNWRQNPAGRPLLDATTGLLFLAGLGIALWRWRRPNYLFVLIWLVVMSLPAALTVSGMPHSSRSIGVLPVACILPAIGLHEAILWLTERVAIKRIWRIMVPAVAVLFLLVALSTYLDYFNAWDNQELPPAFDMAFVEAAEAMKTLDSPGGVWILPLTSLAEPRSVHYTVEFLYRGNSPHHFLRVDEDTVGRELTSTSTGHEEAHVIEWNPAVLGGAYLYHADPKGVLAFLLTKYGEQIDRQQFEAFDVASYRLPPAPHFAVARSFEPLNVAFDNQIALKGVSYGGASQSATGTPADVETHMLPSGKQAWVALQWQALTTPSGDYKASVYLADGRARMLAQMDKVMLSNDLRMTSEWQIGQTELDYYNLASPPATPPGEYRIELAVYDSETMNRLPVLNEQGKMSGQSFRLGTIQVVEPFVPPEVEPQVEIAQGDLAPGIRLLGYDPPLREVQPGSTMRVALYWEALRDVENDYMLAVELRDQWGEVLAAQMDRPVDGNYPTTQWDEGEILRDWHDVVLPPDTPHGTHEAFVKVLAGDLLLGEVSLGMIEVQGRPRSFTVPEIERPLQLTIGERISLLGYDLSSEQVAPGGQLSLTLYWQATGELEVSYTVFTHLLDEKSQIRAQKDSIPGRGSLPTTSWMEDEVITDIYDLVVDADAPPGEYMLEIGMYDALTGQRLPINDDRGELIGDRVLLGPITVLP